jgi:hypothetical protein
MEYIIPTLLRKEGVTIIASFEYQKKHIRKLAMLFERPILQIERRIKIKEKVILIEYGSSTTFQVKSVHFADLLYSVEKKCA